MPGGTFQSMETRIAGTFGYLAPEYAGKLVASNFAGDGRIRVIKIESDFVFRCRRQKSGYRCVARPGGDAVAGI